MNQNEPNFVEMMEKITSQENLDQKWEEMSSTCQENLIPILDGLVLTDEQKHEILNKSFHLMTSAWLDGLKLFQETMLVGLNSVVKNSPGQPLEKSNKNNYNA